MSKQLVQRLVGAFLIALMVVAAPLLIGCSDSDQAPATEQGRRFTIPAAYFGSNDARTCEKILDEKGATDIERNDDGSYTVTMADSTYEKFLADDLTQTKQVLDAIVRARDYPNIIKVTYSDDLTEVVFTCDKDDMGEQGASAARLAIYTCCLHQTLAFQDLACNVVLVNQDGTAIARYTYPE